MGAFTPVKRAARSGMAVSLSQPERNQGASPGAEKDERGQEDGAGKSFGLKGEKFMVTLRSKTNKLSQTMGRAGGLLLHRTRY